MPDSNVNTGFGQARLGHHGLELRDDKGNATVYATYDQAAVLCRASTTIPPARSAPLGERPVLRRLGHLGKNGAGGYFQAYGSTGKVLFTNTVDGKTGHIRAVRPRPERDLYNYGPLNFYQRPTSAGPAGGFLNYEINSHLTTYMEVMYSRNTSDAQIAPSGDFFTHDLHPLRQPAADGAGAHASCVRRANLAARAIRPRPSVA